MLKTNTLVISHRGNLSGPNPNYENSPRYLEDAINVGFDVECDVHNLGDDNSWYLGHDRLDFKIDFGFFEKHRSKLWCHCKDMYSLYYLSEAGINCFAHNTDSFVLSYTGFIITYPDASLGLSDRSIAMLPEKVKNWKGLESVFGLCTDYPVLYKNLCIE